jgi:GNAT superfamily N-acetyltransferase
VPQKDPEVRRAETSDIDEVSDVLASACHDYPWTRWTIDADDHRARIRSLQRLTVTKLAFPYGQVWVSLDPNGEIASAAVWMDPSLSPPPEVLRDVASESAVLEGSRHPHARAAQLALESVCQTSPHYYLGAVGTRPDRQRGGYGRAVLQPVLDLVDQTRIDACLETSTESNLRFYAALGFGVIGEVDAPGGGPHVWAMLRSAR